MNRTITQLVNLLRTFADELEGHCVEQVASAVAEAPPVKRGRPKKEEQPSGLGPEVAAATENLKNVAAEAAAPEGMKLEELQALIQPAVKAAAGKQVKDLIAKHGGTQLSNLPPAAHAAFAEDVKGLVY